MKVLLGIGGSPDSLAALSRVVERAASVGDALTIAIVENPAADRSTVELAERVERELEAADIDADVRTVAGDPGSRLVEIAESEGYDVIALGGGEQTPMGKISVGSIAEFVILNSRVSVFLVR